MCRLSTSVEANAVKSVSSRAWGGKVPALPPATTIYTTGQRRQQTRNLYTELAVGILFGALFLFALVLRRSFGVALRVCIRLSCFSSKIESSYFCLSIWCFIHADVCAPCRPTRQPTRCQSALSICRTDHHVWEFRAPFCETNAQAPSN